MEPAATKMKGSVETQGVCEPAQTVSSLRAVFLYSEHLVGAVAGSRQLVFHEVAYL